MKKLLAIAATLFVLASCGGNDTGENRPDGYNNTDTTAGQRSDTSSYERMPNKTSDTSRQ